MLTEAADQDLITCGKCQQEFYLCHINAFIQHKISKCNKESCSNNDNKPAKDEDNGGGINQVPSDDRGGGPSSPLKQHGQTINFQTLFSNKDSLEKIIRDELARNEGHQIRSNQQTSKADAATITVYSGKFESHYEIKSHSINN